MPRRCAISATSRKRDEGKRPTRTPPSNGIGEEPLSRIPSRRSISRPSFSLAILSATRARPPNYSAAPRELEDAKRMFPWAERLWKGDGIEPDPKTAEHWMRVAAGAGVSEAEDWLNEHGMPCIEEWDWVPRRSLGLFEFGQPIQRYVDSLALSVDETPKAHDSLYTTPYYYLFCQTEKFRLTNVAFYKHPETRICFQGTNLIGLPFESLLELVGARDFVINDFSSGDFDIESEEYAAGFTVEGEVVVGMCASLDPSDPLWD